MKRIAVGLTCTPFAIANPVYRLEARILSEPGDYIGGFRFRTEISGVVRVSQVEEFIQEVTDTLGLSQYEHPDSAIVSDETADKLLQLFVDKYVAFYRTMEMPDANFFTERLCKKPPTLRLPTLHEVHMFKKELNK